MELSRKVFKAVEFEHESGVIRIEEEFNVNLTQDTGETFEGIVTKLAPKELQIRQEGETFERVFAYETLVNIQKI